MTRPRTRGIGAAKHCTECGVELKPGVKYCDFCGTKVAVDTGGTQPAGTIQARLSQGTAARTLTRIAVGCLVIGGLVYVGNHLKQQEPPPASSPSVLDGKHQASAACEVAIRQQARGPFRVIALRSALVAEERGEYVVSGSVELQSVAGEVQRKRYYCRFHRDAQAGLVLDEGKMY